MIAVQNIDIKILLEFIEGEAKLFLQDQCARQGMTLEYYAQKLATQGTIAYKLVDGKMVGFVIGYTSEKSYRTSYITQVFVSPKYRGQHISYDLMCEYVDYCKLQGLSGCWLTTQEFNKPAISLYKKMGFIQCQGYVNKDRKIVRLEKFF